MLQKESTCNNKLVHLGSRNTEHVSAHQSEPGAATQVNSKSNWVIELNVFVLENANNHLLRPQTLQSIHGHSIACSFVCINMLEKHARSEQIYSVLHNAQFCSSIFSQECWSYVDRSFQLIFCCKGKFTTAKVLVFASEPCKMVQIALQALNMQQWCNGCICSFQIRTDIVIDLHRLLCPCNQQTCIKLPQKQNKTCQLLLGMATRLIEGTNKIKTQLMFPEKKLVLFFFFKMRHKITLSDECALSQDLFVERSAACMTKLQCFFANLHEELCCFTVQGSRPRQTAGCHPLIAWLLSGCLVQAWQEAFTIVACCSGCLQVMGVFVLLFF